MNDCMARYSNDGRLVIPCVAVPYIFGSVQIYEIELQQNLGTFNFDLDWNTVKIR